MSWCTCYMVRGGVLVIHQGGATLFAAMWGRGQREKNVSCSTLIPLSVIFLASHKQIVNSPVRLGDFPATTTPTYFLTARSFESLFSHTETLVSWSVSLPHCSSQLMCIRKWDHPCVSQLMPHHVSPPPGCLSLPLLPRWMTVSLTSWLSDFHANDFLAVLVVLCF